VDEELEAVHWGVRHSESHGYIDVMDITSITTGYSTPNLLRMASSGKRCPAADQCFSIVSPEKTLDLIVEDAENRGPWVNAFQSLLDVGGEYPQDVSLEVLKEGNTVHKASPPAASLQGMKIQEVRRTQRTRSHQARPHNGLDRVNHALTRTRALTAIEEHDEAATIADAFLHLIEHRHHVLAVYNEDSPIATPMSRDTLSTLFRHAIDTARRHEALGCSSVRADVDTDSHALGGEGSGGASMCSHQNPLTMKPPTDSVSNVGDFIPRQHLKSDLLLKSEKTCLVAWQIFIHKPLHTLVAVAVAIGTVVVNVRQAADTRQQNAVTVMSVSILLWVGKVFPVEYTSILCSKYTTQLFLAQHVLLIAAT
jgi:hypothetical protein